MAIPSFSGVPILRRRLGGWGGMMASRLCYWFSDIGVRQIHISPDVNYTNAVHADKWIPVLPNTDAALQLAIAYVWLTEGTYDREYLDSHAIGFENFAYYVMGGEDGVPKTPKWAEKKCGVPAYTIKALARHWAKHAVSIAHCNGAPLSDPPSPTSPPASRSRFSACRASASRARTSSNASSGLLFGMQDG